MTKLFIVTDQYVADELTDYIPDDEIGCLVCEEILPGPCKTDHGIGPYEYWGDAGWHHDYISECCQCKNTLFITKKMKQRDIVEALNDPCTEAEILVVDVDNFFWDEVRKFQDKAEQAGGKLVFAESGERLASYLFKNFQYEGGGE